MAKPAVSTMLAVVVFMAAAGVISIVTFVIRGRRYVGGGLLLGIGLLSLAGTLLLWPNSGLHVQTLYDYVLVGAVMVSGGALAELIATWRYHLRSDDLGPGSEAKGNTDI